MNGNVYYNLIGMKFLLIPGGRFQMGAEDIDEDSRPVHWVRISPFWLSETPVTNQQYEIFLEASRYQKPACWRTQGFSEAKKPVVGVSWYDATAFCEWLSGTSGYKYCLPSEAQWEFAAKGTDNRLYPWGNEDLDDTRAVFGKCLKGKHVIVGSFPMGKGPFGTLDQAGNVWEWCQDVWDEEAYIKRKEKDSVDPVVTDGNTLMRVFRGGGYWNEVANLRCAYRDGRCCRYRHPDGGFRVAFRYKEDESV